MAEDDELLGTLVAGRYRVIKKLGEGGMGAVYLGEHEAIEKKIALKVLHQEYSRKEDIVTRFQQEAISASRVKHPNVLDVFDFGKLDNGSTFLAMEFLQGRDLADELEKHGAVDSTRGIRIALQICRALVAAHKAGVVHRDMKPDNVFLQHTDDGEEIVKIVDFGIAQLRDAEDQSKKEEPKRRRLTKTGMIFGTPEYMSPEQASGKKADQRVDVYAVGIILYEMFTGAVPFTGSSFMEVLSAHLNSAPPPMTHFKPDLTISHQLQNVIMAALSKSPDDRYPSMGDFAAAIMATPEGQLSAPPSMLPSAVGGAYPSMMPSIPPAPSIPTHKVSEDRATAATAFLDGAPAAARTGPPANTQLDAETNVVSEGSGKGRWIGVAGAVAIAAAAAGFLLMPKDEPATAQEPAPSASVALEAPPPTPAPKPTTTTPPKIEPAAVGNVPDGKVTIRVDTDPQGGSVSKDGFQACEAAPCELTVEEGDTFELDGKKGTATGKLKVLAQKDKTVTIVLKQPVVRNRPATPPPQKMCEVDVGGLKILRPCK